MTAAVETPQGHGEERERGEKTKEKKESGRAKRERRAGREERQQEDEGREAWLHSQKSVVIVAE